MGAASPLLYTHEAEVMGERTSRLNDISQLTGQRIDVVEDIRAKLPYLPTELTQNLRTIKGLDAVIDYLRANPQKGLTAVAEQQLNNGLWIDDRYGSRQYQSFFFSSDRKEIERRYNDEYKMLSDRLGRVTEKADTDEPDIWLRATIRNGVDGFTLWVAEDVLERFRKLEADPSPELGDAGSNDWQRVGRIRALQEMGLWVIAQRCCLYHASTDAIAGYEHFLVEAHTNEATANERLVFWQVDDDPDIQTILLEPHWKVWGQLSEFSPVERIATFVSKQLAEGYARAWADNYHALWICTADKPSPDLSNPYYLKTAPAPAPNPHHNDPDDTPF